MTGLDSERNGHSDIAIVGGGPVGSYAALTLSRLGFSVALMEEHHVPGLPTQCAGLVNSKIAELPFMEDISSSVILSEIKGADVHSPSGHTLSIGSKNVKAITIDRGRFDRMLIANAASSGSDIKIGCKVLNIIKEKDDWAVQTSGPNGIQIQKCKVIILCDGSNPTLRRRLGLKTPIENIPGISCEISLNDDIEPMDHGSVGIFIGSKIAPGFFSWAIPCVKDRSMRVGLASSRNNDLKTLLSNLLNDPRFHKWSGNSHTRSRTGFLKMTFGNISLGPLNPYPQKNMLLLGDSSGMTKPTSGGGIYPGLLSVNVLAGSIRMHDDGLSHQSLNDFSKKWKRSMGRELERSMIIRKIIREITDDEMDRSILRLSKSKIIPHINSVGDIDHPFSLAVSSLARDPSLIGIIPRFIPYLTRIARG